MLRWMCLVLVGLLAFGCAEPVERFETSDGRSSREVPQRARRSLGGKLSDGDVRGLLDQMRVALEKRDWETLRKLHWSGMSTTAEDLREIYEEKLDRLGGVGSIVSLDLQPMNAETYQNYMDEEELPGPVELLTGSVEFEIPGQDGTSPVILIWAYTCKEEGLAKIFGYVDISLE